MITTAGMATPLQSWDSWSKTEHPSSLPLKRSVDLDNVFGMRSLSMVAAISITTLILVGCSASPTESPEDWEFREPSSPIQTVEPTPTPEPTETEEPEELTYWPNGLEVNNVSGRNGKSCTFDMCVYLELKALENCSRITLDGDVFNAEDDVVDEFSEDFAKLAKGKTREVELGTVYLGDEDEYVDLGDYTCWK
jgi:hypothetical protein